MRIVIHGMGAVGGIVAAALFRSGQEVVGIARGGMLEAVKAGGLRLRAKDIDETYPVPCVAAPRDIDWRPDDMILLCVKGQDTQSALEDLRAAGVTDQPIFCAQNGVANERAALRLFPNVHGVTVMMPATYITAGEVACFSEPAFGIFDIGRYPSGQDADDARMAAALEAANIGAFIQDDVMASKRGKLLMNLHNIQKAAVGPQGETERLRVRVRAEAEAVFTAAGLSWTEVDDRDTRRADLMRMVDHLPGVARVGSSTNQSLLRGTGRLETDFLNGEIALLARLHGLDAPLNAGLCRIAAELARDGAQPGSYTLEALEAALA